MDEPETCKGFLLAEKRIPIRYQDRIRPYQCRVTFDLTRPRKVLIECLESIHELGVWLPGKTFFIEVSSGAEPIECAASSLKQTIMGPKAEARATLIPLSSPVCVDTNSPILRVNAAIINLSNYWFDHPQKLDFRLEDGTWVFEFTPVEESTFLYPRELQSKLYFFSYHLTLRRADGSTFTCLDAHQQLNLLSTFLSFCTEHWVSAALVEGVDETGAVVMEEWGTRMVAPRHEPSNWLDAHHGSAMVEAFPGFARLMLDADWKEAVRTAVYWYVRADTNHVGPDGAIILLQAALERLAWHILVQQRRAISEDSFSKRLPAADQLRLLLDTSSIPLELPVDLAQLTMVGKGANWVDGPQAFVEVRNQIVHPRKRHKMKGARAYYEALQLGKWYLELILLRAFGFNGLYAKRLKIPRYVGDVEAVPWV